MTRVTVHAAKTNLSKLIAKAEAGEEVIICRGDEEVARLVAVSPVKAARTPGRYKGQFPTDQRFFEELPEAYLHEAAPRRKK